jgi:hypothetical protein
MVDTPEWLKPAVVGAVGGAVAIAIVGFSWGGWVTGGTARDMANDQARMEVVAALVPICIEQSAQDPQFGETIAELKDARSYERSRLLMATGWATMPGAEEPDRKVAGACMDALAARF